MLFELRREKLGYMRKRILAIMKGKFFRNVVLVVTGTASAQLVTMLLSPIITRLYGPEAYGQMGVFLAIVGVIAPVAALTYPIAIVLPKKESEAISIAKLSLYITVVIAAVTLILLILFNDIFINVLNLEEVASYVYLIPLVILFGGLVQINEQWLIRVKKFKSTAKVTFLESFIINSSKVGIGFFHPYASVLIILSVASNGLKALLMYLFVDKRKEIFNFNRKEIGLLTGIAQKYRDFPIFRAPEVFLNAISLSLPVLLLTTFFGPASAGLYAIGRNVLGLPSRLIGKSVGDVFYPRISEAKHNGENLTKLIKQATFYLSLVGFLPFALVILFGPFLFSFVYGAEWEMAGHYARWVAPWFFFAFINSPSVMALPVLSAQSFHLKYTIFMLVVRILMLGVGYYAFESDLIAIALFGLSGAILNIGLILLTLKISSKHDRSKN